MDSKELRKKAEKDPQLMKSLEDALRRNADVEELAGILREAGVGTESAEDLLAEYQRKRGAVASTEHVDLETLRMVSGGTRNDGGCTAEFYAQECASTVDSTQWCMGTDSCMMYWSDYTCAHTDKKCTPDVK